MEKPLYKHAERPIEERVEDLLGRMTIEEKTDQLIQIAVRKDINPNNVGEAQFRPTIGSILGSRLGPAKHNRFQKAAMEGTRLGIPIMFGMDVIHGCVTVYPHSLAQACSFRPERVQACARYSAKESVAKGYHWTFSPMIDVCRDPRWGRVVEGYGEDPYVNGCFGAAAVKGYQGDDLSAPDSIAACLKHYAGYGWSEGGRDYVYTDISMRALWESILPPYKAGVDAGAATIMSAFNDITGTPAVANRYLLTELLRERWGFDGFVVSDWEAVAQLAQQGMTTDPEEQTRVCLEAGNDMDMTDQIYRNIPDLIDSDKLEISVVDESVRRILRVKFRLGLFENPYFDEGLFDRAFLRPEAKEAAEKLAQESLVLLKNDREELPLNAARIALIGPAADDPACLLGSWECCGRLEDTLTIRTGLETRFNGSLTYAQGCDFDGNDTTNFCEAVAAAEVSDSIILCLGEPGGWTGENQSRNTIELPEIQERLLDALLATGKPVILVLVHGRPLGLHTIEPKAATILSAWQPGTMGGFAVADVLLGAVNPSGKLAITFPRSTGHIPTYYSMRPYARSGPRQGRYRNIETGAVFDFGHGLSYTTFDYSPLSLSARRIKENETLTASVTVTNTGGRAGAETVFWYLRDPEARITQPTRRLIHFEKIDLNTGETKTVSLAIEPNKHLVYPDNQGNPVLEAGRFILEASRRPEAEFRLI
ncbi:MAG: glycoside hydrolase family 3 N-terminal domain-containing protein [Lentisphaeria bacterium]|nr:glycoside hydrolase family 3 N-terminal domain-containing protein [Lentisphaeria bacterium]